MATALEADTIEEQRTNVSFLWVKALNAFINKYFLYTGGK
jgi:hypothetical protein